MARKIKINANGNVEIHHDDVQHLVNGGTILPGPGSPTMPSNTNPNTGLLGTVGGGLGLNNNFSAGSANVQAGTNAAQLNDAYTNAESGLGQQQTLANALQPGGTQAIASQQELLQALQAQAQGQGPNPAQAALNQNTGANISNQAALAAGQRGAGSNVGLIARQVGQEGAVTQQNSVGQAATLQAQQQLAAQQQLQTQQAQLVGQQAAGVSGLNTATQNEQNILEGANSAYNNAAVSMQNGINNANATTSAANSGMFGNILGGIGAGAAAGLILAAKGGEVPKMAAGGVTGSSGSGLNVPQSSPTANAANAPGYNSPTSTSSPAEAPGITSPSSGGPLNASEIAKGVAQYMNNQPQDTESVGTETPWETGGGLAGSPGDIGGASAASDDLVFGARGGEVPDHIKSIAAILHPKHKFADGGHVGIYKSNKKLDKVPMNDRFAEGGKLDTNARAHIASKNFALSGGRYPIEDASHARNALARVSQHGTSEEKAKVRAKVHSKYPDIGLAANGGKIPGKAKVDHDSYSNDTVKAMLSPGEVVIPLHVMNSRDPVGGAAKFVEAIIAKHGEPKKKGNEEKDFKSALQSAIKSRKK